MARRRRAIAQTRRSLLEAGTRLVLRSIRLEGLDEVRPLAHIRVKDVVNEAARAEGFLVTTGALYNIWDSQHDYQRDLMFHILQEGSDPSAQRVLRLAGKLFARRLPAEVAFAQLADESFRLDAGSQIGRASTAFESYVSVPEIREAFRAAHAVRLENGSQLYPLLLDYVGMRIRKPYTLDQLVTAIDALSDGLQSKREIVPELFEVRGDAQSIFARASAAIFYAFCEPIPV